ncbi:MAG: metal-dependent transcriptional regulator [Candidatus Riflebacteria bacterium]|nr:metal-dependent transcriptional regulator [Candidatus Riflebacteria bacterium]
MVYSETLTASLEDYLETIFHIIAQRQAVKPKDIAKHMKVANSSVTGALRSLSDRGLINYAPYDIITLTVSGTDMAKDVIRRHETLRDFFVKVLALPEKEGDEAACLMEHSIPRLVLERFIQFAEFIDVCPKGGSKWITGFSHNCDHAGAKDNCEQCITQTLEELKKQKLQKKQELLPKLPLKDMKPGQRGIITKKMNKGQTGRRLVEMGIVTGSIVEMERIAPMGDPIEIKIKGYHLSLRKEEAEEIQVELIK